jgi:hypothetical protein
MTKQQQSERDEYIAKLRETLKPGYTLHTVLRSISRTGMSRVVDVFWLQPDAKTGVIYRHYLTHWVGLACGFSLQIRSGAIAGIKIGGCDAVPDPIARALGHALWPNGFECAGDACRSNDHSNGDRNRRPHPHTDGGYALRQEWL